MRKYLYIILIATLAIACSKQFEQAKPGRSLGEIYLTAPAGERSVIVEQNGLWRVYALEEWLSLDVNGRNGTGAFTFSYESNESDFSNQFQTRLGRIVIQSIDEMRSDTLYVRQQGTPDGHDYTSVNNSDYIEFSASELSIVNVAYLNLQGVSNAEVVSEWMTVNDIDMLAAICDGSLASSLEGAYPQASARNECFIIIGDEVQTVSHTDESLTACCDGVNYVVADFGADTDARRLSQLQAVLNDGYNRPGNSGKWIIGGSLYYYSVMEMGYSNTPSWYPSDPASPDFEADLYAWENNLFDTVWMVNRSFTSTWTDTESWRPDYVYASTDAWNATTAVELINGPAGAAHKAIRLTLKYEGNE